MGRSYGDASLGPHVVSTLAFNQILEFSRDSGIITCESGATIGQMLETCVPQGWIPAVLPGTKSVTVGGAIAANIHGKNHYRVGGFCSHVRNMVLMTEEGEIKTASLTENPDLFMSTCGGMGLTGLILTAEIQLMPLTSVAMKSVVSRSAHDSRIQIAVTGQTRGDAVGSARHETGRFVAVDVVNELARAGSSRVGPADIELAVSHELIDHTADAGKRRKQDAIAKRGQLDALRKAARR